MSIGIHIRIRKADGSYPFAPLPQVKREHLSIADLEVSDALKPVAV